MKEFDVRVTWKGKKAKMTLREEEEEVNGYIDGKTHVLTLEVDDSEDEPSTEETFHHDDLEVDSDLVNDKVLEAIAAEEDEDEDDEDDEDEDEEDDEDDEDEDDEDDEDEDEDEDDEDEEEGDEVEAKVEEDEDADYGKAIKNAERKGVPTIHAVMVVYGEGIDVDSDVRTVRTLLRTLQDQKIVNVSELLLHGAEATGQGALDAIAAISSSKDDVVWFCYSGHGCMEEGDRLFNVRGKMIRRDAIVKAVTAKTARLKFVISDCCAVEVGRLAPEEKMAGAQAAAPSDNLRKLFRDYKGLFDVSSSDSYQYSFGGVFTPTFIDKVLLRQTPDTWAAVFEKTQKLTMASADGALPSDAKKKLQKAGQKVEDHQKPVAFKLPSLA